MNQEDLSEGSIAATLFPFLSANTYEAYVLPLYAPARADATFPLMKGKLSKLREQLSRLTVRCVRCARAFVVAGLRPGDTHVCKECGYRFVVNERS